MKGPDLARRLLSQFELEALGDTMLEDQMERLIQKTHGFFGPIAAICVWPSFVSIAASRLASKGVMVATMINHPKGGDDVERAIADAEEAIDDGADEIDLVFPLSSFLEDDEPIARSMVAEVKDVLPDDAALKVVLRTSDFPDQAMLEAAARLAIEEGADFLKAAPGRGGAVTAPALAMLLKAIRDTGKHCGLIHAGEFLDLDSAGTGFAAACAAIGEPWASIERFRLSAGPSTLERLIALSSETSA